MLDQAQAANPPTPCETSDVIARVAYTRQRAGRRRDKLGPWLEIGRGRIDDDGTVRVYLDRLPVGGFSGLVVLALPGELPPEPLPLRPAHPALDHDPDDPHDAE
jgi:hypothetical protein